jgi:Cu-processing system permease protein
MKKIAWSIFVDNICSRILIAYLLLLALMTWTAVLMEDSASKASLTILNLVLLVVPLMTLLYTTIYLYNSREYIVLLLAQPLRRAQIWNSLYAGTSGSMTAMLLLGAAVPIFLYTDTSSAIAIILMAIVTTMIFSSAGMLVVAYVDDKARGIGLAILIWLLLTMIYDALCLYALFMLSQWPIEKPVLGLLMLNPQDLSRFLVILRTDASAMMGYSGAAFRQFLGEALGTAAAVVLLVLWIVVPYLLSLRRFRKKDL